MLYGLTPSTTLLTSSGRAAASTYPREEPPCLYGQLPVLDSSATVAEMPLQLSHVSRLAYTRKLSSCSGRGAASTLARDPPCLYGQLPVLASSAIVTEMTLQPAHVNRLSYTGKLTVLSSRATVAIISMKITFVSLFHQNTTAKTHPYIN